MRRAAILWLVLMTVLPGGAWAGVSEVEEGQGGGWTRDAPIPLGEVGRVNLLDIRVVEVMPDAFDQILAEFPQNEGPAEGYQFVLVRLEVTNQGASSVSPNWSFDYMAVGDSNVGYFFGRDWCNEFPEHPFYVGEMPPGATAQFNVCWQVRSEDAGSLTMYIDQAWTGGGTPTWFSLGNPPYVAPHAPGLFAAATPVAASSREQPIPVGQPGQFADYRITVDRVVPEADEEVAALVPLAEPEAGNQFTLATVTITYLGPGVGDAYLRLGFYAVAASGTEYGFVVNDCGELPQGLNDPRDLFTGGTVTHDLCWEVPVAEADDLVMQVSSSQFPDAAPAWFALDG